MAIMQEPEYSYQGFPCPPSKDHTLPFKFKRKQFPIRLSFAMTIKKAQGQTIPNVGVYLPELVFSHGQLYIALLRGVSHKSTWILANSNKDVDPTGKREKILSLDMFFLICDSTILYFFRRFGWKLIVKSWCACGTKIPIRGRLWFRS